MPFGKNLYVIDVNIGRMKRIKYTFLLFALAITSVAQSVSQSCDLGFTFEISNNPNWGQNEPVIIGVTPGSPAERAGLSINDIILEVNGNGTYLKPRQTIMSWFGMDDQSMTISIRNLTTTFKTLTVSKHCRNQNAISEAQLAPVFAFYSLEDVQYRRFVIPIEVSFHSEASFSNYRTFDFATPDESTLQMDERINAIFVRALAEKGLVRNTEDPDFIIQTFYSYQSNPLFKANSATAESYKAAWRFDMRNKRMLKIPVYDPTEPVRIDDVAYNLEFGFRFYDRKYIQPGEVVLIWESEVKERLSANYGLIDYLELNLPLMLLKFPYPRNTASGSFEVKHLKYNYTGIGYNIDDLKTVASVDPGSPAERAGIRPGDVVLRIQGQKFNYDPQALTEGYRRFIAETMNFRDKNTRYTDSNGFKECMFWNITHYNSIAEAIHNKRYRAAFSYLFNFNQYIDWNTPSTLQVEVNRSGEKILFDIIPQIERSSHILPL